MLNIRPLCRESEGSVATSESSNSKLTQWREQRRLSLPKSRERIHLSLIRQNDSRKRPPLIPDLPLPQHRTHIHQSMKMMNCPWKKMTTLRKKASRARKSVKIAWRSGLSSWKCSRSMCNDKMYPEAQEANVLGPSAGLGGRYRRAGRRQKRLLHCLASLSSAKEFQC